MTIPSVINGVAGRTEAKIFYRSKLEGLKTAANGSKIDIIDIRHDTVEFNLKAEILTSLRPENGPKKLPTLLLYDEQGLQLFEEVSLDSGGKRTRFQTKQETDHIFRGILSHKC
jgi:hypothetical protein